MTPIEDAARRAASGIPSRPGKAGWRSLDNLNGTASLHPPACECARCGIARWIDEADVPPEPEDTMTERMYRGFDIGAQPSRPLLIDAAAFLAACPVEAYMQRSRVAKKYAQTLRPDDDPSKWYWRDGCNPDVCSECTPDTCRGVSRSLDAPANARPSGCQCPTTPGPPRTVWCPIHTD